MKSYCPAVDARIGQSLEVRPAMDVTNDFSPRQTKELHEEEVAHKTCWVTGYAVMDDPRSPDEPRKKVRAVAQLQDDGAQGDLSAARPRRRTPEIEGDEDAAERFLVVKEPAREAGHPANLRR